MQVDDAPDEWLTLAQAAARLGVSIDTLRRRIRRGELEHRLEPTAHGPAYQVRLGIVPTVGSGPTQAAYGPELLAALDLVREQQQTIVEKAEAAAMWQARAEMLAGELADARGRLAQLEAPAEEGQHGLTTEHVFSAAAAESVATADQLPEPAPRAWWRRLLFG